VKGRVCEGAARLRAVLLALVTVGAAGCRPAEVEHPATRQADVAGAATPAAALPELLPVTASELRRAIVAPGASAVVVNVWATWCLPCRKEFPDLLRAAAAFRERGARLVLVSADFEENTAAAREFLARHGVDFPSYLKVGKDMEFIDALSPGWGGALPATFVFDGGGVLRDFWEGETSYETFAARIGAVVEARAGRGGGG
jgi:thiol:disulfide interchange protein